MANLAATDVTIVEVFNVVVNNKALKKIRATATLATQGAATDGQRVLASAFGLTYFEATGCVVETDQTNAFMLVPSLDRTYGLIIGATTAPGSISGAVTFFVEGR